MADSDVVASRIHIRLGDVEIELEGSEAMVKELLESIKKDGLGKLGEFLPTPVHKPLTPPLTSTVPFEVEEEQVEPSMTNLVGNQTLSDIVLKDVAKSERELVLIYGFWLCEVEKKSTFGRADIIEKYDESGRLSDERKYQITTNIKRNVKKDFITELKKDSYSLKNEGKKEALKILSRTTSPKKKKTLEKKKSKPKNK